MPTDLNSPKGTINRILKREMKKILYELIQQRVHLEAVTLLKETHMDIKEIPFKLDIFDSSYFSRN
ncbi:hypothetical protein SAMN05428988_3717 [Chitinophaga sp. YR573]|nr:hypothetical protein SAMN05428988_3717 [Chitinophaga sp. YR573]